MSNFFSLNTALTGLRAAQVGLETASHNVANANTKGYTRQRVDLASRAPYASPVGPLGTGVDVASITRVRDAFLDARARASIAQFNGADARASLLQRTEAVLGEPDNGLTGLASEVWAAFEDLAMDPADLASRRQAVGALETLSARVRTVAGQWDLLAADTTTRLTVNLEQANDALARLAELNRQIPAAGVRGMAPNDLLNERDLLLDGLSGLLGASVTTAVDGTATVSLGGRTLVRPAQPPVELTLSGDRVLAGGVEVVTGGEAAALQRFVATELPARRGELTRFAADFADAVNAEHRRGYAYAEGPPATSVAGGDLLGFDAATGSGAAGFVVTLPGIGALATAGEPGPAGGPPAANDGSNAARIAELRTRAPGGADAPATLDQRLRAMVVGLGREVAAATRDADAQESAAATVEMARQGAHGVSLDEEMVAVVAYQRALEASSRVMSAIDEALDVLINRTGIVGR